MPARRKVLTRGRRKKKKFKSPKKINPHQLLFPQFQDDVQVYFNPVPSRLLVSLKENIEADIENFHGLMKDLGIAEHHAVKSAEKVPKTLATLSIQKISKLWGKAVKKTSGIYFKFTFRNNNFIFFFNYFYINF